MALLELGGNWLVAPIRGGVVPIMVKVAPIRPKVASIKTRSCLRQVIKKSMNGSEKDHILFIFLQKKGRKSLSFNFYDKLG